jgi:hypothetical protein
MTSTQGHAFDWPKAIEKNRVALLRVVEMLFALIGLDETAAIATLPRCTRNYVLRILRPAESAARRLIVVAARGISVTLRSSTGRKGPQSTSVFLGLDPKTSEAPSSLARTHSVKPATATSAKNLPLLDPFKRFDFTPRRRYARTFPRISIIGVTEPRPIPEIRLPSPGDPLDATRLCRRLSALKAALDDIPGQAKRLARWEARRDLRRQQPDPKPGRNSPMRPGWPPGYRKRPVHEIDDLLRECHSLAVWALKPDTS